MSVGRDLGDFQTPPALVNLVVKALARQGRTWSRVLEPTCGSGGFIAGLMDLSSPPLEIQAIELQERHAARARGINTTGSTRISVITANLFDLNLRTDLQWKDNGPMLVIGNPPWITNSELGVLSSSNLPAKTNLKGLRGIDAVTGRANFDIAEYIWIKLIRELSDSHPTIGLLCKTSVARNVLQFAHVAPLPVAKACIHLIDTQKWFDASADACFFCLEVGDRNECQEVPVYADLAADLPATKWGFSHEQLVADLPTYDRVRFVEGPCPITWRQGIKHDAATVMELDCEPNGRLQNKLGEDVVVEPEYVYPLLKGSDIFSKSVDSPHRAVIVTQRHPGEDTHELRYRAPKLWEYLCSHRNAFAQRRSSIYRDKSPFAIFGVGDYSFTPFKVAVAGLYKRAHFQIVGSVTGRPIMLDDTCYFASCNSSIQAAVIATPLKSTLSRDFIDALAFPDSKRPITKRLLQRIDLTSILRHLNRRSFEAQLGPELAHLGTGSCPDLEPWPDRAEAILRSEDPEPAVFDGRAIQLRHGEPWAAYDQVSS